MLNIGIHFFVAGETVGKTPTFIPMVSLTRSENEQEGSCDVSKEIAISSPEVSLMNEDSIDVDIKGQLIIQDKLKKKPAEVPLIKKEKAAKVTVWVSHKTIFFWYFI